VYTHFLDMNDNILVGDNKIKLIYKINLYLLKMKRNVKNKVK